MTATRTMTLADIVAYIEDPESCQVFYDERKVKVIDNWGGFPACDVTLWVIGNEFGVTTLVHAKSVDDAWSAWLDEQPTIHQKELIEAFSAGGDKDSFYGEALNDVREREHGRRDAPLDGNVDREAVRAAAWKAFRECEAPALIEGYEFQSNFSGTGIVDVGHYMQCYEADLEKVLVLRKE